MASAAPGVVVVWSGHAPTLRVFRAPVVFGRSVLGETTDDRISRDHIRVECVNGLFSVTDLGSRNGTYVNGHALVDRHATMSAPIVVRTGRTISLVLHDVTPFEDASVAVTNDHVIGARMAPLWRAIEQAAERGRDVVIHGERGVGKRTLAEVFARRRRVLPASAHPYRGAPPADETETALIAANYDQMSVAEQTQFGQRVAQRRDLPIALTHVHPAWGRDPDLAARLERALVIEVPPLRARFDEIPHFIVDAASGTSNRLRVHATVVEACLLRQWPGNITELLQGIEKTCGVLVQRGTTVFRGELLSDDFGHETDLSRHCRILRPPDLERLVREANLRNLGRVIEDARASALRDEVWRNPESDDARLIYADHLLEHGDPRGELIALQISRQRTGERAGVREQQLAESLATDIAGPLAPYLRPGFQIRRGFVAACEVTDGPIPPSVITHRAWSTIESIETDNVALLKGGALVSARRLATSIDIVQLSQPFEVIVGPSTQTPSDRVVPRGLPQPKGIGALKRLRTVSIDGLPNVEIGHIAHLDVVVANSDVAPLRALFERSQLHLLTVRCRSGTTMLDPVIAIERGAGRIVLELGKPGTWEPDRILEMLRQISRGIPMIEVHDLVEPARIVSRHAAFVEELRADFQDIVLITTPTPSLAP